MKKLLFYLTLAVAIMAGCKSGNDEKTTESGDTSAAVTASAAKVVATGNTIKKTLNNVDSTEASVLISNYKKGREGQGMIVENASYFLNRRMVEKILAYMTKEGADGIRFHLGKKSAADAETMLLPVSTKPGSGASGHTDYYDHDEALFDTARIVALRINKKGNDPGAVLYDKCPTCPDLENGCKLTKGALPRSYAEKMIQGFTGKNMNTDAIWLPIDMFKGMLNERNFNGIRVYFGTYPDGKYTPPGQSSYAGRNTIVLTYADRDGIDNFNCDPLPASAQKIAARDGGSAGGPPQNNGGLCPNLCD